MRAAEAELAGMRRDAAAEAAAVKQGKAAQARLQATAKLLTDKAAAAQADSSKAQVNVQLASLVARLDEHSNTCQLAICLCWDAFRAAHMT